MNIKITPEDTPKLVELKVKLRTETRSAFAQYCKDLNSSEAFILGQILSQFLEQAKPAVAASKQTQATPIKKKETAA